MDASQKFARKVVLRDAINNNMMYLVRAFDSRCKKHLAKNEGLSMTIFS